MKLTFLIAAIAIVLSGCSRQANPPDAIDHLMVEVSHQTIGSYLYVPIDLPPTASPAQLISALSKRGDLRMSKIERFKILKIRPAQSGPADYEHYTAVLLDTNVGQKIVLLRPASLGGKWNGWYFVIYDSNYSASSEG